MVVSVPVVDLFAGAGGLGLGATLAGADLRLSIEIDPFACATLKNNPALVSGSVLQSDVCKLTGKQIRKLAGLAKHDRLLIIGGPPCQPFSKASYWTDPGNDSRFRRARARGEEATRPNPILEPRPDQRRSLIEEFLRLIIESKADGFLFENVPSILHPRNKKTFEKFRKSAQTAGFKTTLVKANAAEYGVPQKRHRVILLGLKKLEPSIPETTHEERDRKRIRKGKKPVLSAGKAINKFSGPRYSEHEEVVKGLWAEQLKMIPPGMNYKALTAWAGHPNPIFEAETRFWHFLLKLSPRLPSWTIAANPGPWTGPFHWDNRRLRTVELAVLQSFPPDFQFMGNRRDRVRQIGNAMPPLLAQRMLEPVIDAISRM